MNIVSPLPSLSPEMPRNALQSLTAQEPLYLFYLALKVGDKVHFHEIWAMDSHKKAE